MNRALTKEELERLEKSGRKIIKTAKKKPNEPKIITSKADEAVIKSANAQAQIASTMLNIAKNHQSMTDKILNAKQTGYRIDVERDQDQLTKTLYLKPIQ